MANTEKKVHCINWMHDALLSAYDNGNRGAIKSEAAILNNVTESQFAIYKDSISVLYEALCDYVRYGKSKDFMTNPMEHEKALKERRNKVFDLWRQILDWGEAEKDQRRIIVHPRDIEDLMTVVQRFQANAVNTDMDENFVAQKVWATVPEGIFRNKVETILGIRMNQAEVMTDNEREFLRALNKLVGTIRKNNANIEAEKTNKSAYEVRAAKNSSEAVKAEFKALSDICDAKIAQFQKKVDDAQKKLDEIKGLTADEWSKKNADEKAAKAEAAAKAAEEKAAVAKAEAAATPAPAPQKGKGGKGKKSEKAAA